MGAMNGDGAPLALPGLLLRNALSRIVNGVEKWYNRLVGGQRCLLLGNYHGELEETMTRNTIMAGNWKMFKTVSEAAELAQQLKEDLADVKGRAILVCPPFTALNAVGQLLEGSNIHLGAQNLYPADEGAYTGEISPKMLVDSGCRYVILGHSERRQHFNESDAFIRDKIAMALEHGLKPILCVGETLEQRGEGRHKTIVSMQVYRCLQDISPEGMKEVSIAYEPIWAIGTGYTAAPDQADAMHTAIRNNLSGLYGEETAQETCIMYGGSVKPDNVDDLMAQPDIDGVLVGGASLSAESFARIVKFHA
jgi:triosephosphate isomerase